MTIALTASLRAWAQKFVANAPEQVAVGQQFRLTFTINTQQVSGFHPGDFPEGLEVLMGPSTSSQSSFQMVNGRTSSSSSITYTYILCAEKKGKFTIPAAKITADGKSVTSNSLQITVNAAQQGAGHQSGGYQGSQRQQMRPAGSNISASDLYIQVSANKKHVVEQEPVLLTYKVYTLVDLTQLEGKMPDLKGFHTQEVQLPHQKSFKIETVNGRPYKTVTWSQYVMFPQQTGKLEIPALTFNGVVVQQNRSIDPFEAFFNGGSGYVEVKKKIVAPGMTIQVDPLPAKPADFSLGVGQFSISAQIDKTTTKANDPVKLRVVVSGSGNLKLIKEPVTDFPKDFDKYDPKVTDKTKLTANGVEGSIIYDYLLVPRHQGKFEIPPVEFTYYNTAKKTYQTIRTEAFTLNVEKGAGGKEVSDYTGKEDVKQLNKDIRYIRQGDAKLHDINEFFFGSDSYMILLVLQLVVFISLFAVFRHKATALSNESALRGKKANSIAARKLKKAGKLLKEGRSEEFYDETLRALWGYVGDKLNMPAEQLTRDNVSVRLAERNVDEETVKLLMTALDECEFERYAPGDQSGNMQKTYEAAMQGIMSIENAMKKNKKNMKKAMAVMAWLMTMALAFNAQDARAEEQMSLKQKADQAYAAQNYQEAIRTYELILKEGVSPEVYYNLGNAYYRTENITYAIINYERALLLSPGDADIRFNLQMAREKTIDKITPVSEMFFVTWYRALVNMASVDGWAVGAQILLTLAVILVLVYLFTTPVWLRKCGFFGAFALLVAFGFCNLFAYQQKEALVNRTGAVVTASAVTVKSTPAQTGTDLFVIHEGTKVEIIDDSMKEWKEVRMADGKQGWLQTRQIEKI